MKPGADDLEFRILPVPTFIDNFRGQVMEPLQKCLPGHGMNFHAVVSPALPFEYGAALMICWSLAFAGAGDIEQLNPAL